MPGSMPYSLEKGPYLSVIEDYVNGTGIERSRRWRSSATATRSTSSTPSTRSRSTPGRTAPTQLRDHFKRDWLGYKPDGQGGWLPPPPFDEVTSPTTGFWQAWHGDCEGVLRLTLIRALEVSLGIPHTQAAAANATQHWPIELFWRCPIPWFEGWVTWRASSGSPKTARSRCSSRHPATATRSRTRRCGPTSSPTTPRTRRPPSAPKARGSSASGTTGPASHGAVAAQPAGHRDVPDPWPRLQQRGNARHREPGGVGGRSAEPTHTMGTPRVLTAGGRRCRRQTLRWSWSSRT